MNPEQRALNSETEPRIRAVVRGDKPAAGPGPRACKAIERACEAMVPHKLALVGRWRGIERGVCERERARERAQQGSRLWGDREREREERERERARESARARERERKRALPSEAIQGYLAHKKRSPRRILQ